MTANGNLNPFQLMDCALITMATGKRAMNLRELRDRIVEADESCLYYHFFENLLRPSFGNPEFRNDFARWAKRALHDIRLAEKLGTINPVAYASIGEMRQDILDVIEDHLAETEYSPWTGFDHQFHFMTSRVVVFDTKNRFDSYRELAEFIPTMSTGSIFYHFIEARRRPPLREDDFTDWLLQWGEQTQSLREKLALIDYYYWTVNELRDQIYDVFMEFVRTEDQP